MYEMPEQDSLWRRKKDGRVDKVSSVVGVRYVEMFSPATGRFWRLSVAGLRSKYTPAEEV